MTFSQCDQGFLLPQERRRRGSASVQSRVGLVGFHKAVLDGESSWCWSATYAMAVHQCSNSMTFIFIFCPRVSLSASLTRNTVAANAQRHGSHPAATGSSCLDRHATGRCHGPALCVRTPSAVIFLCMKSLKSHVISSSPNARALVNGLFISLKAFFC